MINMITEAEFLALKPSELLELALHDLEECERDPRYNIDMNVYHRPSWLWGGIEGCRVCLAGAVMAKSLGAPIHKYEVPSYYDDQRIRRRLVALDFLRAGEIGSALCFFDIKAIPPSLSVLSRVPRYSDGPDIFKDAMRRVVADLQSVGL